MKMIYRYILTGVCILSIGGCAGNLSAKEKLLYGIYRYERMRQDKPPIIFIHGLMGSVLHEKDSNRVVWGQHCGRFANRIALPISGADIKENTDAISPVSLLGRFYCVPVIAERDVYEEGFRAILRAGGYELNKDAFILSYDWRRDLVEAAKKLDLLIELIRKKYDDPKVKVDLICHSAGGLVARYYVKYGAADFTDGQPLALPTYEGAESVNKVIMLGTPNRGSLVSFKRLNIGYPIPAFADISPQTLFTLPSLYEVMPFYGEQVFVDGEGRPLKVDIYDPGNWEKYGWSVFDKKQRQNIRRSFVAKYGDKDGRRAYEIYMRQAREFLPRVLKRARSFQQALWQGDPLDEGRRVKYIILGANSEITPRNALLEEKSGVAGTIFTARTDKEIELLCGFGDTVVTKESLLGLSSVSDKERLPASSVVFISAKHRNLTKDIGYLNNIFYSVFDR